MKNKPVLLHLVCLLSTPTTHSLAQNMMGIDGQTERETRILVNLNNVKKKWKIFAVEITTNPSFYNSFCPEQNIASVHNQNKTFVTPQGRKEEGIIRGE